MNCYTMTSSWTKHFVWPLSTEHLIFAYLFEKLLDVTCDLCTLHHAAVVVCALAFSFPLAKTLVTLTHTCDAYSRSQCGDRIDLPGFCSCPLSIISLRSLSGTYFPLLGHVRSFHLNGWNQLLLG